MKTPAVSSSKLLFQWETGTFKLKHLLTISCHYVHPPFSMRGKLSIATSFLAATRAEGSGPRFLQRMLLPDLLLDPAVSSPAVVLYPKVEATLHVHGYDRIRLCNPF